VGKYIKSNTLKFDKWKSHIILNDFNLVDGEKIISNYKDLEMISKLFDHFQICPNARFDSENGVVFFSQSKRRKFKSLNDIQVYISRVREYEPDNIELSLYFVSIDIKTNEYILRWGKVQKSSREF
jgi:hypothetical protein